MAPGGGDDSGSGAATIPDRGLGRFLRTGKLSSAPASQRHHVGEQHRDRHGTYTSGNRGYGPRDLRDGGEIDVAYQPGLGAVDSHVDNGGARLHHLAGERPCPPHGRDEDVGAAGVLFEIHRPGVTDGYGRVGAGSLLHEQGGERLTHDVGTSHHHDMSPLDPHSGTNQELLYARRSGGGGGGGGGPPPARGGGGGNNLVPF